MFDFTEEELTNEEKKEDNKDEITYDDSKSLLIHIEQLEDLAKNLLKELKELKSMIEFF